MKQKHKRLFLIFANTLLAFLMLFANPLTVLAQATPPAATPTTTATPTVDHTPKPAGDRQISITNYLCTPQGPDNPDGVSLFDCINRIYRFSLVAAFFLAVLFIASAGYMYMSGGEKGKEKAKSIISSTFVAIVILTTSFILLRQINPELVTFKDIQPLEIADVVGFDGTIPTPEFPTLLDNPIGGGGNSDQGVGQGASGCSLSMRTEAEASQYMTSFDVMVWDGSRSVSKSITVQKCIKDNVAGAFSALSSGSNSLPIKSVSGYTFRSVVGARVLSVHAFGLAIDINPEENCFLVNGKCVVGSFWKPCPGNGCSEFSIPRGSPIVNSFKSKGFGWGGDWNSKKDYMHFSCASNEQGTCSK